VTSKRHDATSFTSTLYGRRDGLSKRHSSEVSLWTTPGSSSDGLARISSSVVWLRHNREHALTILPMDLRHCNPARMCADAAIKAVSLALDTESDSLSGGFV
jgi:hypothetical protein